MKYVLDSSVALKWVLVEQHSDKANRLRADFSGGCSCIARPRYFPWRDWPWLDTRRTPGTNHGRRSHTPVVGYHDDLATNGRFVASHLPGPCDLLADSRKRLRLPVCRPRRARGLPIRVRRRPGCQEPPGNLSIRRTPLVASLTGLGVRLSNLQFEIVQLSIFNFFWFHRVAACDPSASPLAVSQSLPSARS